MGAVIVNGVFVGLVYGLLGVGFVVVYRGSGVVNFAYGETGMVAAFVLADLRSPATDLSLATDRGLLLTLPLAIFVGAAIGAATEVVVARPLRAAPRVRALVGTVAVGSLLLTFSIRNWGLNLRPVHPIVESSGIELVGLRVSGGQLLIAAVCPLLLGGLWALYRFTPFGLRLRAVAVDPYAAGLVGVNVNRTSMATWALAGAIGAVSAILIAPLVAFSVFFMTLLTVRALASALLGGLTSTGGTFVAGVGIGVTEAIIGFKSPVSGVTDVVLVLTILALMLLRPTGLVRARY